MTGLAAALLCAAALAEPPAAAPAPLFPVVKDGKWGYVDRAGKVVVSPRFDAAERFSEGLAPVRQGKQLGYADATGALVLVPAADLEPAGLVHLLEGEVVSLLVEPADPGLGAGERERGADDDLRPIGGVDARREER